MSHTPHTINEVFNLLNEFIGKAATKDDLVGLAKTEDITALEEKVGNLQCSIKTAQDALNENVDKTKELNDRLTSLEADCSRLRQNETKRELYDRRMNLLVFGMPEKNDESKRDCLSEVRKLLVKMKVPNADHIHIVDAHRLGKKYVAVRPIIFKVADMFALRNIIKQLPELKKISNTVYFRRHLPKAMRDQREKLKIKMQKLYDDNMKPKWQIDYDTCESYIKDKDNNIYKV